MFKKLHFSRRTNLVVTIIGSLVLYGAFIGGIVHFAVEHADETEIEGGTAAPLLVSQLYDVDESAYEIDAEEQHSVAAGFVRYDASPKEYGEDDETPGLAYRVTTVKLPFIYDLCMDGIFREFEEYKADFGNGIKEEYKEIDAAPWGAEKAYCMYYRGENQYQYIICWPDKIAEIRLYSEPTDKQVRTMAEKLK